MIRAPKIGIVERAKAIQTAEEWKLVKDRFETLHEASPYTKRRVARILADKRVSVAKEELAKLDKAYQEWRKELSGATP